MDIDYEKLKLAHHLIQDCDTHFIRHIISNGENEITLCHCLPDMPDIVMYDLDELITKLIELTQPKHTYWYINDDFKIVSQIFTVEDIRLLSNARELINADAPMKLYESKTALIEAQAQYWLSLLNHSEDPIKGRFDGSDAPSMCVNWDWKPVVNYEFPTDTRNTSQKDCKHEYNLLSGFRCFKCGYQSVSNCTNTSPVNECQHVDDALTYFTNPPQVKCRKCGEFYR